MFGSLSYSAVGGTSLNIKDASLFGVTSFSIGSLRSFHAASLGWFEHPAAPNHQSGGSGLSSCDRALSEGLYIRWRFISQTPDLDQDLYGGKGRSGTNKGPFCAEYIGCSTDSVECYMVSIQGSPTY